MAKAVANRDAARAAQLKARGVVRKTQRCPNCYSIVTCESVTSKFTHVCNARGGA